jgi:hypothetical protein
MSEKTTCALLEYRARPGKKRVCQDHLPAYGLQRLQKPHEEKIVVNPFDARFD